MERLFHCSVDSNGKNWNETKCSAKDRWKMCGIIITQNRRKSLVGMIGTSLVVQGLRWHTPNAGGPGSIAGQGSRFHM